MVDERRDAMPLFRVDEHVPPLSPMELSVRECKVQRACELNLLWHSRFPIIDWSNVVRNKDYVCYIAEKDFIGYAVAIWSSPIAANRMKDGDSLLELRRMAIAPDAPFNTASRMLKLMRKDIKRRMPHIRKLVSYQDTEVHSGTIYKASGWVAAAESKGVSWQTSNRVRNKDQSTAPKIRWEYNL
jgi:hypothetical protein